MTFKPGENLNLTGALRASLRIIENDKPSNEVSPNIAESSPLQEVDPNALDEELTRLNENLIQGIPEKITDDSLAKIVDLYRAQALKWSQDEQTKKRAPSGTRKKTPMESLEL